MEIEPNIIVYHCNDIERCDIFLEKKDYMIESKEDGIWLGEGMYFWDNYSNANYWLHEKERKDTQDKQFSIIKGNAIISIQIIFRSPIILSMNFNNIIRISDKSHIIK